MFSGASGSATSCGSNPSPSSSTRTTSSRGSAHRRERELHRHQLAVVFAVAVLDRVDDRLAHRHADPVDGVFVHAGELADAVADDLHEVDHVEVAVDLQADGAAAGQHAGTRSPARLRPGANERRDADTKCTRVSNILNRIPPQSANAIVR